MSDRVERACWRCGSLLHHEDQCETETLRSERDAAMRVLGRLRHDVRVALSGPPGPSDALAELVADVERVLDAGLRPDHVDDLREAVRIAKVAMYREGM